MNSLDYVDATNLAKLRIVVDTLKNVLLLGKSDQAMVDEAVTNLHWIITALEKKVRQGEVYRQERAEAAPLPAVVE